MCTSAEWFNWKLQESLGLFCIIWNNFLLTYYNLHCTSAQCNLCTCLKLILQIICRACHLSSTHLRPFLMNFSSNAFLYFLVITQCVKNHSCKPLHVFARGLFCQKAEKKNNWKGEEHSTINQAIPTRSVADWQSWTMKSEDAGRDAIWSLVATQITQTAKGKQQSKENEKATDWSRLQKVDVNSLKCLILAPLLPGVLSSLPLLHPSPGWLLIPVRGHLLTDMVPAAKLLIPSMAF